MEKVKILWSGITGRTGKEALEIAKNHSMVEIVAGICRNNNEYYNYNELEEIKEDFDIIIDFSHKDSFDKVLNYAIKKNKPLIIGTAGLTDEQMKAFDDASNIIPIFRGGNFRFDVKKFIDDVVEYAKKSDENIELIETHYKTKKVPSETAKVVAKRVLDETGKKVDIKSFLEYDELINDWRVADLHCRVCGFKELAEDVLKIAVMMKDKQADGVYDLDRLFRENKELNMCYSYVMGISSDILKLKDKGFIIENDDEDYMITFSSDKSKIWEEYITENLENGYWNEYIGEDIVFIFKFNNGEVKRYVLSQENNNEILQLCCEFADTNFSSIKDMLVDNKFYKDKLK